MKLVWSKWTQTGIHHTGAIYSSVPTNEFDCVIGSATNTGGGWLRDRLLPWGNGYFTTYESMSTIRISSVYKK